MNLIQLKTKELLKFESGCYGNLATMQRGMWLMPIVSKNLYAQSEVSMT